MTRARKIIKTKSGKNYQIGPINLDGELAEPEQKEPLAVLTTWGSVGRWRVRFFKTPCEWLDSG